MINDINQRKPLCASATVSASDFSRPDHIAPHHWEELVHGSAIDPAVAACNFESIQGTAVMELLAGHLLEQTGGHGTQYVTNKTKRILERYESAAQGGWRDCGLDPRNDFEPLDYGRFKADAPRIPMKQLQSGQWVDDDKPLKYDTPAGVPFRVFWPQVTVAAGYEIAKSIGAEKDYANRFISSDNHDSEDLRRERHSGRRDDGIRFIPVSRLNRDNRRKIKLSGLSDSLSPLATASALQRDDQSNEGLRLCGRPKQRGLRLVRPRGFGRTRCRKRLSTPSTLSVQNARRYSPRTPLRFRQEAKAEVPEFIQQQGQQTDPGFWQWYLSRCKSPIFITEGAKKAAALISCGIAAIALPGVTMWHEKGSTALHPDLLPVIAKRHPVTIAFDQDTKADTIQKVGAQIRQFGQALEAQKCAVRVAIWPAEWGKGVDDVVVSCGIEPLRLALQGAPTLADYTRDFRVEQILSAIAQHNSVSGPIERSTEGEYLPELPPLTAGAIHIIDATMNTGKTYRIGRDWVQGALELGDKHVLVLSPLNSLGRQTAREWGLAHIHDQVSAENKEAFWQAVRDRPGLVLCPDSIGKLPRWFWSKPVVLIIDEGNQVTNHICQGDTFGSSYGAILTQIQEAAQHAISSGGAIVLSEDGIPERAISFWKTISGATQTRYFQHRKQGIPWPTTIYAGQVSGFRGKLQRRLASNEGPLFFVSASQRECKRLEHIALALGRKVVRIDSETNENGVYNLFFTDPDEWLRLHQPEVLILSPSGKSGISIEGRVAAAAAYFAEVWGYFPALDTDTHLQLLGRYRPSVPRHIYVSPFIVGDSEERIGRPQGIKQRLHENLETIARLFDLKEQQRDLSELEAAIHDYLAIARCVSSYQKQIAHAALAHRLEAAGHHITVEVLASDPAAAQTWKDFQEMIWAEEAEQFAALTVEEGHTIDWAWRTLDAMESSSEARNTARKVIWRDAFPGVSFDDVEECYEALYKDYGALRKGVQLMARAENLAGAKALEHNAVASMLDSSVRAGHRVPKNYARALLISGLGILELVEQGSWCNSDAKAIALKAKALHYAGEINYWLRLQIKPEQTPTEIINKLMKKLALEVESTKRPGSGHQRERIYSVVNLADPIRQRLLEAARRKLSDEASTICKVVESSPIQIVDAPPAALELAVGSIVEVSQAAGKWIIERIEGAISTLKSVADGTLIQQPLENLQRVYG